MARTIILFIFVSIVLPLLYAQNNGNRECFLIMAGKKATSDGSVLVAHNNDLTGIETSLVEKYSKTIHTPDSITFPSGLSIPAFKSLNDLIMVKIYSGFAEGDAVAVNESMVAIGGGVALGKDRRPLAIITDTLVNKGITGGIRYYALEEARSARQLVKLIGNHYSNYGVTYPSGVAIADTSEVWYLEAGGGRTWAAVRVPDTSCMVVANGYRIGELNLLDTLNVLTSPEILQYCKANELIDSNSITLNFARTFGNGRENRFYDTRRVWRGISLLAPSLNMNPDTLDFPMFIEPEKKITVPKLISILKDNYNNTPYCPDSSDTERLISCRNGVHTEVVQLNSSLPSEIGAVLWAGLGVPQHAIYIPYYLGLSNIHNSFETGDEEESDDSAFWIFKKLSDRLFDLEPRHYPKVISVLNNFQSRIFSNQSRINSTYRKLLAASKKEAIQFLDDYQFRISKETLKLIDKIMNELKKVE